MKKLILSLTIPELFISCGSFNQASARGEAFYYDTLKQKIMNNVIDFD